MSSVNFNGGKSFHLYANCIPIPLREMHEAIEQINKDAEKEEKEKAEEKANPTLASSISINLNDLQSLSVSDDGVQIKVGGNRHTSLS